MLAYAAVAAAISRGDSLVPDVIPFHKSWFGEEEQERVRTALRGRPAGDGPFCRTVEERLQRQLGVRRVLLTTSCTHALELSLLALGIGPGDEVLCPSFTFVSTANAVLRVGARPVFCEIEDETLGIDVADMERRITARTRAVIPVHYAGIAPDMDALLSVARSRDLRVVEDAAQGLGATYRGRPLGTLGDAGCFSFHDTKNVSCGEGGAVAIEDEQLARRAEIMREKGTNRSAFLRGEVDKYTWVSEGSSYILSDVLAALLDAQLDRLPEIQRRRAAVTAAYEEGLSSWARARGVRLCGDVPLRERPYHIFFMLFPDERRRDAAQQTLRARGVTASFHYVPLHSSPHGRTIAGDDLQLPVTDRVASTLLRLPLFPTMTDADVARVIDAVTASP
jgi:dTDP-4-amino-4,6-dideoxygalactose transaminase